MGMSGAFLTKLHALAFKKFIAKSGMFPLVPYTKDFGRITHF